MEKLTIDSSFNFKKNSFSFLRFFFAFLIMLGHTFLLGGYGKDPFANIPVLNEGLSRIAVYGFFIISGFLVTRSYLNSPNVFKYGLKRFFRIFPGFWMNLIITSFVFAAIVFYSSNETLKGFLYLQPESPIEYIKVNFTTLIRQYNIANLLENNPYPYVFNGSLWTLFLEVKAYILLGIIGIFGFVGKKKYLIPIIFLILYSIILFNIPIISSTNKFIRLIIDEPFLLYGTYFFAGSTMYLFKDKIPMNRNIFIGSVILLVIFSLIHLQHQVFPVVFPLIVIWLANNLPFSDFDKHGDFSYGVYLYAFPVQQLVTYFGITTNVISYFIVCFSITVGIAFASWNLIEKRFIRLKKTKYFSLNPNKEYQYGGTGKNK